MSTVAPQALKDLSAQWDAAFGSGATPSGIVGDANHHGGYHISRQDNPAGNYSITSALDKQGASNYASAVDMSMSAANMKLVTKRIIDAIDSGDPRAKWIAEIYGTVNGTTVVGRLHGRSATSDSSHLWHVHLAVYRAYANDSRIIPDLIAIITGKAADPNAFPLPAGEYFGDINGPNESHGGYYAAEQVHIKRIQAEVGVTQTGKYEAATIAAVKAWEAANGRPVNGQVDATEWAMMFDPDVFPSAAQVWAFKPTDAWSVAGDYMKMARAADEELTALRTDIANLRKEITP